MLSPGSQGGILDIIRIGLCSNGSKDHLSPPWKEGDFCNSIHVLVPLEWRADKPAGDRGLGLLSPTWLLKTHDKSSGIISRDLVQQDARSPSLLPCEPPVRLDKIHGWCGRREGRQEADSVGVAEGGEFPSPPTAALRALKKRAGALRNIQCELKQRQEISS